MEWSTWWGFFLASWILCLSPGPGALKSISTGLRWGYRKGWWNILGLQAGVLLILAVVGTGAGALLLVSPKAFEILKWVGTAYLFWLGLRQFFTKAWTVGAPVAGEGSPGKLFLEAFLVNITNPKAILFFLAVLPPLIDPKRSPWPQYAICAATVTFTDIVVMNGYTYFAAKILRLLESPRQVAWMNRTLGTLFMAAAVTLAVYHRTWN